MADIKLANCRCGGKGDFATEGTTNEQKIYCKCVKCGIRTPSRGSGLAYSAKQEVADTWNAGSTLWPPWQQGYKYQIGDQVTAIDQQNLYAHYINEKADNTQEPRQNGSGWKWVEYAPTEG